MKNSLRIGRIAGIDINIHYTWLLIFLLITWSLAVGYFPELFPDLDAWAIWLTSAIAAILMFVSVLIHELSHSLVAKSYGLPVKNITLFLLGGMSNLENEPEKPSLEFNMSIVGPLSSTLVAALCWGINKLALLPPGLASATVEYLGIVNLLLAAFNILPGFPLDGGRVLRSIIWGATNDLRKATNIATVIGQILGWLVIAAGILLALNGSWLNGIWLVLIGWFLNTSAEAARMELELRSLWLKTKVFNVMDDSPEVIEATASISGLVNNVFLRRGVRFAPVVTENRLQGLVTLSDVNKVPNNEWQNTPVSNIMSRMPLHVVTSEDTISKAINLMAEHGVNQLPVIAGDDRLVGVLSRADVFRYVQMHYELKKP